MRIHRNSRAFRRCSAGFENRPERASSDERAPPRSQARQQWPCSESKPGDGEASRFVSKRADRWCGLTSRINPCSSKVFRFLYTVASEIDGMLLFHNRIDGLRTGMPFHIASGCRRLPVAGASRLNRAASHNSRKLSGGRLLPRCQQFLLFDNYYRTVKLQSGEQKQKARNRWLRAFLVSEQTVICRYANRPRFKLVSLLLRLATPLVPASREMTPSRLR